MFRKKLKKYVNNVKEAQVFYNLPPRAKVGAVRTKVSGMIKERALAGQLVTAFANERLINTREVSYYEGKTQESLERHASEIDSLVTKIMTEVFSGKPQEVVDYGSGSRSVSQKQNDGGGSDQIKDDSLLEDLSVARIDQGPSAKRQEVAVNQVEVKEESPASVIDPFSANGLQ